MDNGQSKTAAVSRKDPTLADLAPKGIDGRLWVKTIKENLLSQTPDGTPPTDAELLYFARTCQASGLDPAKREIYGIYRNVKQRDGTYKRRLSIQTSIDGFRVVAERSRKMGGSGIYGGSDSPDFLYDPDQKISVQHQGTAKLVPNKASVSIIKVIEGMQVRTTRTANWMDYYPGEGADGMMWRKFPEVMLAKVAEAQALRAAFPNAIEGLYLEEEMATPDENQPAQADIEAIKAAAKKITDLADLSAFVQEQSHDIQKQLTGFFNQCATDIMAADQPIDPPAIEAPAEPAKPTTVKRVVKKETSDGATK